MAQMTSTFFSEKLSRYVIFTAIIPTKTETENWGEEYTGKANAPRKTLYLLHGWTGNHQDWLTMSRIYEIAQKYNLAVILPSGDNSFYVDHPSGAFYGEYIGDELIEVTRELFPLSTKREDTWIAGLSMGGYGALRNGLYYSETFSKIAAFSSPILSDRSAPDREKLQEEGIERAMRAFIGVDTLADIQPANNLNVLAVDRKQKQDIYFSCGLEDGLLEENRAFHQYLIEKDIAHQYSETPGKHDWDFWNKEIEKAVQWMHEK